MFIKLGKIRALNVELNKEFGFLPFYKKTSYRCETILDMPYTQVIFTSGTWTPFRRAHNDCEKIEQTPERLNGTDRY